MTDNALLRRPAVTTALLLTVLLVPVVALPYALTRRHIARLSQQIDHLAAANADLHSVVSKSARGATLRREELARATSLLERSKTEISFLRRDISQTQAQLNSFQSATRAELQSLLDEGKLTRHHLDLFPRLGLSLADVAAFMHEMELHQGVSSSVIHNHGIERLRTLALKLQVSPIPHKP
ncbi:hypothetical protein OG21DRAFT_1493471 [Imleria badia]|nr:hypothetical protein OG21DRAFT_1493471 [Imleria badia]